MPEKQLNEVDLDNLPERESRVIKVKMTQDLRIKNGDDSRNV